MCTEELPRARARTHTDEKSVKTRRRLENLARIDVHEQENINHLLLQLTCSVIDTVVTLVQLKNELSLFGFFSS